MKFLIKFWTPAVKAAVKNLIIVFVGVVLQYFLNIVDTIGSVPEVVP